MPSAKVSSGSKPHAGARTRNHYGLSRTGCARCKNQRLKCDEQKPECGRCVRVGAECPGYVQRLKWSTKYEIFRPEQERRRVENETTSLSEQSRHYMRPSELQSPFKDQFGLERPAFQMENPVDIEQLLQMVDDVNETQLYPSVPELAGGHLVPTLEESQPGDSQLSSVLRDADHSAPLQAEDVYPVVSLESDCHSSYVEPQQSSTVSGVAVPESEQNAKEVNRLMSPKALRHQRHRSVALPLKTLNDPSSVLVEFYFKETAQVFSCYDSQMNPFRTTVSHLWGSSAIIYCTLQSMAAACLVDSFPQFGPIGRRLRKEAIELLEEETQCDETSLLALLMLGGTASWHDPRDLGLSFFNRVRSRLASMPMLRLSEGHDDNFHFFHESLIYWEMLLAYVVDNSELDPSGGPLMSVEYFPSWKVPHPWTGIARDTQYTVQEIGRLIRRQRKSSCSRRFVSEEHIRELQDTIATAGKLEERLLALRHPVEQDVINTEDRETPTWHLLTLAEVYRSTGLVQLYHVFPDLLRRRLVREFRIVDRASSSSENISPYICKCWLTSFALKTLSLLKSIPLESGTRDFQPFPLVALSSELRMLPPPKTGALLATSPTDASGIFPSGSMPEVSLQLVEVGRMRGFIQSRLLSFLHILPPKPIHVCLDIVTETWARMDDQYRINKTTKYGDDDVYWMDVMIENGWETTMA
ncbi:hypothetical protein VTN00DRAFT_3208 [Thermoascus crustaceus]|uniref:uncharacterized protein n=1 Tax=Thermoascus crustaceus TaxID=5088 RepID=UPI0037429EBE